MAEDLLSQSFSNPELDDSVVGVAPIAKSLNYATPSIQSAQKKPTTHWDRSQDMGVGCQSFMLPSAVE
jgi:hypothetical protein